MIGIQIYRIVIAEKIKNYRAEHQLSQSEFGTLMGVSAQAVNKWEHEMCHPDISLLPWLAECLGCRLEDFFDKVD